MSGYFEERCYLSNTDYFWWRVSIFIDKLLKIIKSYKIEALFAALCAFSSYKSHFPVLELLGLKGNY